MTEEIIEKHPVPIIFNKCLSNGIYELAFRSEKIAKAAYAGQFVNLYLPGGDMLLPRPFGISNVEGDKVTIVYAVIGGGTKRLSTLEAGMMIDVLGPNGSGFDYSILKKNVLLIGGGLGVPPLLLAAKQIKDSFASDLNIISVLGYRNEPFYLDEINNSSNEVYAISENDTNLNSLYSETGNVIDVLNQIEEKEILDLEDTMVLACGPKPMLIALSGWCKKNSVDSQFSLEERMGCGYGACVGCVCSIKNEDGKIERKKVCKDGPVFNGDLIVWD